jgi:hypothetical protein
MTIVLQIPTGAPAPDLELSARQHDAALVAQARNATIAECQHELRHAADLLEQAFRKAGLSLVLIEAYRYSADMLEALRT